MKIIARLVRYSFGPGHYLFAGVVLLRFIALARLSYSPFMLPARGDMHFYNDWAQHILHGALSDHLAFYGLPLYAYLLAFLYKIFGYGPYIPALLQSLLDGGTSVLIYHITTSVFPLGLTADVERSTTRRWRFVASHSREIAALLGGIGWAFFVPAQAYSIILMPTAWLVFVFWFVVWKIVKTQNAPTPRQCLILGLLIGFTAMAVATILFLVPLILAALWVRRQKIHDSNARAVIAAVLLLFGVGVGTSPCWIHNYFVARDPVFLSAHSGINFWIGNNPEANGYPRFPPGLRAGQAAMLEDSITGAETAAGHPLKRAEVSAYWSAKAKNYIATHFREWMGLSAIKLRNFWNAFQYDDLSVITNLREQNVILPGIYFGIVAALALPGMLLSWRMTPRSRWIAAAIFLHMCALLPVFVTERYRLAVVPGLLIFAVIGLSILWESCVSQNWRLASAYVALLLGSTIFVSWPQRDPSLWALDAYNSGWQALEGNDLRLAESKLALAHAYVPDNAETNFALGNLRFAQHRTANARAFYQATLDLDPRHKGALNNLGVLALEDRQFDVAEMWLSRAINVDPRNAKTHFLLAKAFLGQGDHAAAQTEIERALVLEPSQPQFTRLRDEIQDSTAP